VPAMRSRVSFPPGFFSAMTISDLIERVPDPAGVRAKVHALLKLGGTAMIVTPRTSGISRRAMGKRCMQLQLEHSFNMRLTPPQGRPSDRIPELDGVRGCAIAMVLLFHFRLDLPQNRILEYVLSWGWAGVNLFFALSGFLITHILLRTLGRSDYFRSFYLRRALRIFPVYYWTLIAVGLLFGVIPALQPALPSAHDRIFYWFYLSNWTPLLDRINQGALGHFWSLAVEEQFYWLWPLVIFLVPARRLAWVAGGVFASALLFRFTFLSAHFFIHWNTFGNTDSLMVGALSATAWQTPALARWMADRVNYLGIAVLAIGASVVIGDRLLGPQYTDTIGTSGLALAFGALLWHAALGPRWLRATFRSPALTTLGKYSYGIYVYHQPLYFALMQLHVVRHGWAMFTVAMTASIGLAVLSFELAEKRILRLKEGGVRPEFSRSKPDSRPTQDTPA